MEIIATIHVTKTVSRSSVIVVPVTVWKAVKPDSTGIFVTCRVPVRAGKAARGGRGDVRVSARPGGTGTSVKSFARPGLVLLTLVTETQGCAPSNAYPACTGRIATSHARIAMLRVVIGSVAPVLLCANLGISVACVIMFVRLSVRIHLVRRVMGTV